MPSTQTKHPVVLIHGVFGYGKRKPLWNTWSPYWPEQALTKINPNHLIVDVGALSSDHDRACEAFYQLHGGTVDYGEEHSCQHGHLRYGDNFPIPMYREWSAENPVHLVGHSFGATTAIELYQLICQDAFGVGSNYQWVKSITCIAGPLTGTTLTHLFGLHEPKMVPYTIGHVIGSSLGTYHKVSNDFPVLKQFYDFKMPQWRHVNAMSEILSPTGRLNNSVDLAVYDILPAVRIERNGRLIHMDKPFLVSITTSPHFRIPFLELGLAVAVLVLLLGPTLLPSGSVNVAFGIALAVVLRWRIQSLDYAAIPSFYWIMLAMQRRVRTLHQIFDEFHAPSWELNDGAVNVHSMLRPWFPTRSRANSADSTKPDDASDCASTASTSSCPNSPIASPRGSPRGSMSASEDPELFVGAPAHEFLDDLYHHDATRNQNLSPGRWYVHRVQKNHLAGTHFDGDAPDMYRNLFKLIAQRFEDS